ncbi:16S rRNA (guanine(527)-N(7))-methyltransferase RsmG [bacterium]|nr:16S rRNA (guanine(527)-N(7))-methyltransferase RsmG [bacterium]
MRINFSNRSVDAAAAEALDKRLGGLASLILAAAGRMNLTADRDPELFWARHIEDGLAAGWAVQDAAGIPARVLDVGSGAGLPGFVWALMWPESSVSLLEARSRRGEFLKQAAAELGLDVPVLVGRAETLARDTNLRESFDLVTARAVAALPSLLELTIPFVRVGGHVAAIKSTAGADDELAAAKKALGVLGAGPDPRRIPYDRPDGKPCEVILVRKIKPTPPAYPRRDGLPQNKPIQ